MRFSGNIVSPCHIMLLHWFENLLISDVYYSFHKAYVFWNMSAFASQYAACASGAVWSRWNRSRFCFFLYFLDKAIKFLLLSLTIHICTLQVHIGWHARWVECPFLMALLIRHPQCIMVVPLCISIGLGKFIGPAGVSSILIRLQNKATQIACSVSSQFF